MDMHSITQVSPFPQAGQCPLLDLSDIFALKATGDVKKSQLRVHRPLSDSCIRDKMDKLDKTGKTKEVGQV